MKAKKEIVINLYDIYTHSISSRSSVSFLLDKYRKETDLKIVFNFDRMAFCSRSAAQQMVLEQKKLLGNNIKIEFRNVPFEVNKILELAQHKLDRKKIEVHHVQFSTPADFESFMLAI